MDKLKQFNDYDNRLGFNMMADVVQSEARWGAALLRANSDAVVEPDDEDMIGLALKGEAINTEGDYTYRDNDDKYRGIYMYHSAFSNHEVRDALVSVTGIGGSAKAAVNAARVSYGRDSKEPFNAKDRRLILRLLKDRHGSPLEHNMISYKVLIPNPIFKQTLRHRVGVSFNEYSGRYSIIKDRYYIPLRMRLQNQTNHQGSSLLKLSDSDSLTMRGKIEKVNRQAIELYHEMIVAGVSKEIARFHLPSSFYTEAYVTFNLRSLLHYLNLRVDAHAQYEIQEYAKMFAIGAYLSFPEFFELALSEESNAFLPEVKQVLNRVLNPLITSFPESNLIHSYYGTLENEIGLMNVKTQRRDSTGYIRMIGN